MGMLRDMGYEAAEAQTAISHAKPPVCGAPPAATIPGSVWGFAGAPGGANTYGTPGKGSRSMEAAPGKGTAAATATGWGAADAAGGAAVTEAGAACA